MLEEPRTVYITLDASSLRGDTLPALAWLTLWASRWTLSGSWQAVALDAEDGVTANLLLRLGPCVTAGGVTMSLRAFHGNTLVALLAMSLHSHAGLRLASITLRLGALVYACGVTMALRVGGRRSIAGFTPAGVSTVMLTPLAIIEATSAAMQPVALGVRLASNLSTGHLCLTLKGSAADTLGRQLLWAIPGGCLALLELMVSVVQAYTFTLLTSLYLA